MAETKAQIALKKQNEKLSEKLALQEETIKTLTKEYGLREDIAKVMEGANKMEGSKLEVVKDIIDKTKSVLDNTKNITEETFTQVDLHKLERKAIAEGLEDRVKIIQKMKSVQQIQKETNRIVNVQVGAFKSIGGSIDSMIKSIPLIGNTLSEALGISDMTENLTEEFRTSFSQAFQNDSMLKNVFGNTIGDGLGTAFGDPDGVIGGEIQKTMSGGISKALKSAGVLAAAVGLFKFAAEGGTDTLGLGNRLKRLFFRSSFDGFKDAFGNLNQSTLPNIFRAFQQQFRFGIGAADTAKILRAQIETGQVGVEAAFRIQEAVTRFAGQRGVLPADVMADLASNTELFAKFAKDGGLNLGMAAVQAKELGLSLDVVGTVAESVLDFQSSIEGELKASLLIGRQLNLNRARELSLAGDIAGLQQEIVKIVGTEAEFNRLNVIERKALAQALGLSVTQLQKYVSGAETLKDTALQQNTQMMSRLSDAMLGLSIVMGASLGMQVFKGARNVLSGLGSAGMTASQFTLSQGLRPQGVSAQELILSNPNDFDSQGRIKSKIKSPRRFSMGSLKGPGLVGAIATLSAFMPEIIGGVNKLVTSSDKVEENTRKTVSTMARDSNWPLITSDKLGSGAKYIPNKG